MPDSSKVVVKEVRPAEMNTPDPETFKLEAECMQDLERIGETHFVGMIRPIQKVNALTEKLPRHSSRSRRDQASLLLGLGVRWYTVVYILDVYIEAHPLLVEKSSRQPPISHCNTYV